MTVWERITDGKQFGGDYAAITNALFDFEKYCEEHADEIDDPYEEVGAIIESAQLPQRDDMYIGHMDDYGIREENGEIIDCTDEYDNKYKYHLAWDNDNIAWEFPDDSSGHIWF